MTNDLNGGRQLAIFFSNEQWMLNSLILELMSVVKQNEGKIWKNTLWIEQNDKNQTCHKTQSHCHTVLWSFNVQLQMNLIFLKLDAKSLHTNIYIAPSTWKHCIDSL